MVSRYLMRMVEEGQEVIESNLSIIKGIILRKSISEVAYLRSNNYEVEELGKGAYVAKKKDYSKDDDEELRKIGFGFLVDRDKEYDTKS